MTNGMEKIMNIIVNSCKKTVELIDKRQFVKLNIIEKIQLLVHKSMCETCTAYEQRSKFLDKAVNNLLNPKQPYDKVTLSEEKKSKILEELKK